MVRAQLSVSQLRRLIYEELIDHYLVQKELWNDRHERDQQQKMKYPVNKGRSST